MTKRPITQAPSYPAHVDGVVTVTRDGVAVATVADVNAAFSYILRAQSSSVEHACRHEGWSWRAATDDEKRAARLPYEPLKFSNDDKHWNPDSELARELRARLNDRGEIAP